MDISILNANFIWTPDWNAEDDAAPRVVRFRKEVMLNAAPESLTVKLSADKAWQVDAWSRPVDAGLSWPCADSRRAMC